MVQKRLKTVGWRDFAHPPLKFSHWETLPALPHGRYITDSRQTLAHVIHVAGSRWALPCILLDLLRNCCWFLHNILLDVDLLYGYSYSYRQ